MHAVSTLIDTYPHSKRLSHVTFAQTTHTFSIAILFSYSNIYSVKVYLFIIYSEIAELRMLP